VTIIRVFPTRDSLMRIVASECIHASEKWIERKYMEIATTGELSTAI